MISLKDKVVLITGASSGIGKAAALKFAEKGAKLVLAARRTEKLQQLQQQIASFNENCFYVTADLTRPEDVTNLFDQTCQRYHRLDILVNCVGCGLKASIPDTTFEDFNKLINANLTSVFLCSKEAFTQMAQQKPPAHIITVCSVAGLYGGPTYSAYCAAKHGVTGFMRSLKFEGKKHRIKASTIFPMRVDTEFFDDYRKKPTPRQMLKPSDIADDIIALASRSFPAIVKVRSANFLKRIKTFFA